MKKLYYLGVRFSLYDHHLKFVIGKMRLRMRFLPRLHTCRRRLCIVSTCIIMTVVATLNLFTTVNLLTLKRDVPLWKNRVTGLYVARSQHTGPIDIENISEFPLKLRRADKYRWNDTSVISKEFPQFAPAFNETEYNWYVELIRVFDDTCKRFNITYFIEAGSVIGAYTHHGFIPWDDDFDVKVNASQKHILKMALHSVPDHGIYTPENRFWKFWHYNFSRPSKIRWGWPYIDIVFFDVNDTHEYDVSLKEKRLFNIRSHIFPLRMGLFENLILPVPGNMEAYLNNRYKMDKCYSNFWSHIEEKGSKYRKKIVPCDTFSNIYPFVHRFRKNNITYEELRLGNEVFYTLLVN